MFFHSNKDLVEYLKKTVLKTPQIISSFLEIDRKNFVKDEFYDKAYFDIPLEIFNGQTISQPFTVAFMMELLSPTGGQKILDIGFGSGWTTCLLANIVKNNKGGKVYALEIDPEVFEFGKKNIEKYNFIKSGIVEVYLMDGSKGFFEKAPFDRILVSASCFSIPSEMIDQLKDKGILVIPDKNGIWKVHKNKGKIRKDYYEGFVFVPLID
jgi:protein-L-isoaspartate(D-aspartate) O-methyltransferase